MTKAQFTNRLHEETSPYLRQHAHNPVDWHPWDEQALELAQTLNRPIFLSIGYSACHWCHVMEHESFENEEIAQLLNESFVSIKVDREERPDLDQIYMASVQRMTGQGGWPMSVFLTPALKPFFGGTYFPPEDMYGRPGFKRLLLNIARLWKERRAELAQQAEQLTEDLQALIRLEPGSGQVGVELLRGAGAMMRRAFDPRYGGFGTAPKFPHSMELRLLLRLWRRFGDDEALNMARRTLDHMARGGMYDHLGGGFHRYSTDARWLVPHFEKMLYDNALLPPAYLDAWQATGEPFYRQVVEETLDYVLREMTSPEGAFCSTQDADSEGVEGKFFVWSLAEIEDVLGKDEARLFADVYDVTLEGNWEGHNILHRARSDAEDARLLNTPADELRRRLDEARNKLLAVRGRRVWPGRDEKVLTSWNALMISAFAQAAQALDRPDYADAAARAADFLLTRMRRPDGLLWRTCSSGAQPKLNAYLEDYSFLADALASVYEATFQPRWISAALELINVLTEQFWDDTEGGFFYTGRSHEQLIARSKDPHDSSIPSANSMAVLALLRLAKLTGRRDLLERAEKTLSLFQGLLSESPLAAGQMLICLDFFLGPVDEFAVVGNPVDADTKKVLQTIRRAFQPNRVIAFRPMDAPAEYEKAIPLLAGKTSTGAATTYICRDFACQQPIEGVEPLIKLLTGRELAQDASTFSSI